MKNLVVLSLLLALIQAGHALTCYKCNGCENTKYLKETCRDVDPLVENVVCLTQRIRQIGQPQPTTVKKCVVHEKNKPYWCTSFPGFETMSCDTCQGDLCNAASPVSSVYVIVFCLFLLPKLL